MKLPIPCSIVTGQLGSGKTTCIQFLISKKPASERWAIIVNEFGKVGIDGAILSASAEQGQATKDVAVRELAGGCMCCTLSGPFASSIAQVVRQTKPDRLIIEPSGLGHPAGLMDVLQGEHLRSAVKVNAVICLVNIGNHRVIEENAAYYDQVNIADVLVGNKSDLASPEQIADFHAWAEDVWPPKAQVHCSNNTSQQWQLPGGLDLLDLQRDPVFQPLFASAHSVRRKQQTQKLLNQQHQGQQQGEAMDALASAPGLQVPHGLVGQVKVEGEAITAGLHPGQPLLLISDASPEHIACGWMFHIGDIFEQQGLLQLLKEIASYNCVVRLKGVFRVPAGINKTKWVFLKQHQAESSVQLTFETICYRKESRLELIVERAGSGRGTPSSTLLDACRAGNWKVIESHILQQMLPFR